MLWDFLLLLPQLKRLRHLTIPTLRPVSQLHMRVCQPVHLNVVEIALGHCQAAPLPLRFCENSVQLSAFLIVPGDGD